MILGRHGRGRFKRRGRHKRKLRGRYGRRGVIHIDTDVAGKHIAEVFTGITQQVFLVIGIIYHAGERAVFKLKLVKLLEPCGFFRFKLGLFFIVGTVDWDGDREDECEQSCHGGKH